MLKIRRSLAIVLALLLALGVGGTGALAAPKADTPASPASVGHGMYLEKSVVDGTVVKPGEYITYNIRLGCSSIELPCTDAVLVDKLPPPLVISSIDRHGFEQPVNEAISEDRTQLELKFNEFAQDTPDDKGLVAGSDYNVTIVAQLPADASAELDGTSLVNEATLTSDLGTITDAAPAVPVVVDAAPNAEITKSWEHESTVAGEETANAITLGGIRNTSKVGAMELRILEPSGNSAPFAQVAFTGFGAHTFPEGADLVAVNHFIGDAKYDGVPSSEPTLPEGAELADITGFEIVYSSSLSTDVQGGIVANGTAGSVVLNTTVRPGIEATTVENETSIVALTPKGDSEEVVAEDAFEITAVDYSVEASKSFTPSSVVAELPGYEGRTGNSSKVTIGAKNTSNQPLKTMTIAEPATGTAPFGEGIDFVAFLASKWPANTDSIIVKVNDVEYAMTNNGGNIALPAGLPSGTGVKSFVATFTGTYAPGAKVGLEFDVTGNKAAGENAVYSNTVLAGGTSPGGTPSATDEATATLTVVDPGEKLHAGKTFSNPGFDNRVEGIVGDKVTATLYTKPINPTNVDVRTIVQTDNFETMVPTWKANSVQITDRKGATTVKVEYLNGDGEWTVLVENAGTVALALPAGAEGVRITYLRTDGTFPKNQDVKSNIEFELTRNLDDKEKFTNILSVNRGDDTQAEVVVDQGIQLVTGKSWNPKTVVQKPSAMNPASQLKLSAQNTSTYAVDSLKLSEPTAGTTPFDYVDITKFEAILAGGANVDTARLKLTFADGTNRALSGAEATKPATVEGIDWANVVGFDFSLEKTGSVSVPRGTKFDLNIDTKLRTTLRGTDTSVDAALAALDPAYVIKNAINSTISRGDETAEKPATADLSVVTNNSVSITPTLTKSFNPAGPTTLFPIQNVDVTLALSSGTDKGDKIVVEDIDPTFWNAFDFVAWKDFQSGPTQAKMTYEFFTGASYATVDGKLVVTGGEWVKAENLATTMAALNAAHTGKAPATAIEGFRVTIAGNDYTELARDTNTLTFTVKPRYELRSGEINSTDGESSNAGESKKSTVANTASGSVSRLGDEHEAEDVTAEYTFSPGVVDAAATKSNDAPNQQVAAGGRTIYTMTVENKGTAPILNPKIVDVLPSDAKGPLMSVEADFAASVVYTLAGQFADAKAGTTITEDPALVNAMVDGAAVSFTFPQGTILYPGEKYTVKLPVQTRAGVTAGTDMTNTVEFTGDNMTEPKIGESNVVVIEGQGYASMKLVREVPTAGQAEATGVHNTVNNRECYDFGDGFYRYPCVVETKPGGTAEWKLTVTNTGNVPTDRLEIVDVFPWVGDHGVTSTQLSTPRGTKWTPTLLDIKEPALASGATRTLSYLVGNPADCKPNGNVNDGKPWEGCEDNWVSERPANPKDIKGLKAVFDFAPGLAPLEGVELSFTTESATEMPDGAGELAPAWNSFGYYARAQVNGNPDHRSQEPIKTGVTFRPVEKEKVSVGDYVWVDGNSDGRQDEGEKGIKDVVLTITGPDGKPVTDVYGNPVLPTMTDADGKYTFENLPVLKDGESYTVSIDREASAGPLAPYTPTKPGQGDREEDSSTWSASSEGLTQDGDRDPTLDFGFIVTPEMVSVGDFVWVDSNRDGVQSEGEKGIKDVVLTITGPDGKPVVDVFGNEVVAVTTDEKGAYTFENLPVLKDGESYTVSIDRDASAEALAPYIPTITGAGDRGTDSSTWTASSEGLTQDGDRDPTLDFGFVLPKVSVGDFVWVDSNRDGVQSEGEKGIKDVVLTITGPDGKPVVDVFGNEVVAVTTDEKGAYTFENLPVLKDGESYTVSIDREASKESLAPYIPTIETEGNREGDSSTWTASSEGLTQDGDRDPTLDFGFVLPKVSVGDFVWVDSNRDGVQSEGEKGIKDVVLTITGPDGKPVVDVFGNEVVAVTTDEKGAYTFENLPVLKDGESYTVSIDRDASAEALAPYIPTITGAGDRGTDSSTWTASSEGLTQDGDRDPTLDFGFVLLPEAPVVTTPPATTLPATPADPVVTTPAATGGLSNTGFDGTLLVSLGILLTMLGGGAVALTVRRRRTSTARH